MNKTAFLTGGTGFVGAVLARRLLALGHRVHLLVRPNHAGWRLKGIEKEVTLHTASLGDRPGLEALLGQIKPDWIFHLAVYGAYSSQKDLDQMVSTNFLGTVNLVEAARRVGFEALVNTGSSSEYGFKDHAPHEEEWVDPNSHYALTKAAATQFCRHTARAHGLRIPTLRLYSAYGPFEEPTRLMPTLLVKGRGGGYPVLADPAIARDFVYVEDVAEAFVLAARTPLADPGVVLNVGSGQQATLGQAVDAVRSLFAIGKEPVWGTMPSRAWDTSVWVSDPRRIQSVLGWRASTTLAQGLEKFADWLNQNPDMLALYESWIETGRLPA